MNWPENHCADPDDDVIRKLRGAARSRGKCDSVKDHAVRANGRVRMEHHAARSVGKCDAVPAAHGPRQFGADEQSEDELVREPPKDPSRSSRVLPAAKDHEHDTDERSLVGAAAEVGVERCA